MAKGKKREKTKTYVGSASEKAKAEEARIRSGGKKAEPTVNLVNAEFYAMIPPFIWLYVLVLNTKPFLASPYWLPTLIMALSLGGLLHESSKRRFVKHPTARTFVNSFLMLILIFSVILTVMAGAGVFG